MFFVISGYCICAACDGIRARGDSSEKFGVKFFRRRFKRIYPPYWIFLLGTAAIAATVPNIVGDNIATIPHPLSLTAQHWLGNITLTETWRFHLMGGEAKFLALQAWTLCYEEQFYLVSGIVLICAGRRFFSGMILVTLAVLSVMMLKFGAHVNGYFFDGNWLLFAEGILLYWMLNYGSRRQSICVAALLLCLALATAWTRSCDWWYFNAFCIGPAFTALLIAVHPFDARVSANKWLRPLWFCGVMCYSLYLIHLPVTKVVSHLMANAGATDFRSILLFVIPLGTGASLLVAAGFHHFVERRFLNAPLWDDRSVRFAYDSANIRTKSSSGDIRSATV